MPDFDIVITTALVPGRPGAAADPRRGGRGRCGRARCIVDLAAETGGNCELTSPGEEVVRDGVTIVGFTNLPSLMAADASRLYARNVSALLQHLAPSGELALDFDDEITGGACVTRPTEEVAARHSLVIELTILCSRSSSAIEVISKVPTMLHTPLMSGTNSSTES